MNNNTPPKIKRLTPEQKMIKKLLAAEYHLRQTESLMYALNNQLEKARANLNTATNFFVNKAVEQQGDDNAE